MFTFVFLKITRGGVEKTGICLQNIQYLLNSVFIDINMRKNEQVCALCTPPPPPAPRWGNDIWIRIKNKDYARFGWFLNKNYKISRRVIKYSRHSEDQQQRDRIKVKTPIFSFEKSPKPGRCVLTQKAERYLNSHRLLMMIWHLPATRALGPSPAYKYS